MSILSAIGDRPMRKTWIMNGANLNHALVTKHLENLVKCGFLACDVEEGGLYELTELGRLFLEEYSRFRGFESRLLESSDKL